MINCKTVCYAYESTKQHKLYIISSSKSKNDAFEKFKVKDDNDYLIGEYTTFVEAEEQLRKYVKEKEGE